METPYVFLDKPLKTWAKHVLFKENHMENIGKPEILWLDKPRKTWNNLREHMDGYVAGK